MTCIGEYRRGFTKLIPNSLQEAKRELMELRRDIISGEYNHYVVDFGMRILAALDKVIEHIEETEASQ